jgi:membrane protease YdiL (CAAX protease family)
VIGNPVPADRVAAPAVREIDGRRPHEAPPWIDPSVDRTHLAVALGVVLLISRLPEIVAREVLSLDVPWMGWAVVAWTAVFWLAARFVAALRPLERFLAVMVLVNALIAVLPIFLESAVWRALVPASTPAMVDLLATRVLFAGLGLLVLAWAMVLGASRAEVYATVGDVDARTRTQRKDGTYLRWRRFGPIAAVFLALLMVWFGFPMIPASVDLPAALPAIAIGLVAALLNAWWEETAFRAAPLSMLQRAIGPGAGVVLLALFFGLGHFYGGIPSGPMGLLATGAVGLLLGRAMIETRGLAWPVGLHLSIDAVIFTFLALESTAA